MIQRNKTLNSIILFIQPLFIGYLSSWVSNNAILGRNTFKYSEGYLKLRSLYNFIPAPYVFAIVWPILYILMGIAIWRIYRYDENVKYRKGSLILNQTQIILSFLWSPVYLYNISYAFAIILMLDIVVWILLYFYYKVDKVAFLLMLPYALWLLFATFLNYLSL